MINPLANTLLARKLGFDSPEKLAAYLDFIEPTIAAIQAIQDTAQHKWGIWISGAIATGKTTLATLLSRSEVIESTRVTTSGLLRLCSAQHGITVAIDEYKSDLAKESLFRNIISRGKTRVGALAEPVKVDSRLIVCSELPCADAATYTRFTQVRLSREGDRFIASVTPPERIGK